MTNPWVTFPVVGVIYDIDKSTLKEGVVVTAYNQTTEEEISETSTTNSSGEYTLDLANFDSGYSNGDKIILKATYSGTDKIKEYYFEVNTTTGYENKNLTLTYEDPLGLVKELLSDNWQSARCDLKTPAFQKVFELKRVDLNEMDNKSLITFYEVLTRNLKNSIGEITKKIEITVNVDLRSTESRVITLKMRNEIDRIFNSNITDDIEGFHIIDPDTEWRDLSDKSKHIWRFVMSVKLIKEVSSRSNAWWS